MEINRIENIRNEEKEQRQVSQTCENIREAGLRWLGHVERNIEVRCSNENMEDGSG